DAARRRDELVREVLVERHRIDATAERRIAKQPLQLRGEYEPVPIDGVVQGLDAHAVASQEHCPGASVDKSESEHPVQSLDHALHQLAAACRVSPSHAADPTHYRALTAGLPFVAGCLWGVFSMISRITYTGFACDSCRVRIDSSANSPMRMNCTPTITSTTDR